jgi:subtilisin family serine protease
MRLYPLLCPCLFLLGCASLSAQPTDWTHKIDPALRARIQAEGSCEFLVILTTQADVSAADKIHRKEEKGQYVYETLLQVAEATQPPVRQALRNAGAPLQSFWVVNALWSKGDLDLVERLAQMPEVERVENNPVLHLDLPPQPDESDMLAERTNTPMSWGLTQINADDVWAMGFTGSGVVMGGQDTGYEWQHPAIKDKYRGWNGTTANHNYNFHDAIHATINGGSNSCGLNLTAPCDDDGHGTHTMGTMCGGLPAPSTSTYGVAPDAKWIGCRNMEEGDGTPATYIECFQWFIAPTNSANTAADASKAPHVINNSWGCPGSEGCNSTNYATMNTTINNVRSAGILVVVSAGNSGPACSTVNTPPAIFASAFAVGALQNTDVVAGFSSRGPATAFGTIMKPDISAPGVSILSSVGTDNNAGSYTYASFQGTSMAGPHVAGVAALMMSARPDLMGNVPQLENILKNTAVPLYSTTQLCGTDGPASRPNNVYGYGRVDALLATIQAISLPVEWVSFDARPDRGAARLNWVTATEVDCKQFDIQRSSNGLQWAEIGSVECRGTSGKNSYEFIDNQPLAGINYYRLRQTDQDNTYWFSPAKALSFSDSGISFRIVPEQSVHAAFVHIAGGAEHAAYTLDLYALDGRLIQQAQIQGATAVIALQALSGGLYVAAMKDEAGRVVAVEKMWW